MTEPSKFLQPAPMEGNGAYNRSSSVQAVGTLPAVALLERAARAVALPPSPELVIVADYGSSEGHNSLVPMAAAIRVLRERVGKERAIFVFHTDLPGNDFTALFQTLANLGAITLRAGYAGFSTLLQPNKPGAPWSSKSREAQLRLVRNPTRKHTKMRIRISVCFTVAAILLLSTAALTAQPVNRITILYDAFGKSSPLKKDWGFSAFVEYNGKRILFDTGNNADTFGQNVKALGIDLKKLDFVVISHRHGDHTSGLNYLLSVNPSVRIYTPKEGFGVFGAALPGTFYRKDESLPVYMRYYDGQPPEKMTFGTPWRNANFVWIDNLTEVVPGIFLISTVSQTPGTLELRELSLAIKSPKGVVLGVGCSHPGIEKILEASMAVDKHVHLIFGGLHLVTTPDPEIGRIAAALHDQWKVDRMAPGHCTGEPAFEAFRKAFGDQYLYAGLGSVIELP